MTLIGGVPHVSRVSFFNLLVDYECIKNSKHSIRYKMEAETSILNPSDKNDKGKQLILLENISRIWYERYD